WKRTEPRAEVAAVLFEDVADLGGGAVAVVGHRLDDQRDAARTVAFVRDFLVRGAFELAGAAFDGALDVVLRHVVGLRLGHGRTKTGIAADVTTAEACGNGHFLENAREDLAALRVGSTLLVL